jgi:hypothetical protein
MVSIYTPTAAGIASGTVVMFVGVLSPAPLGWAFCNGSNGTPDIRERMIKMTTVDAQVGTTTQTQTSNSSSHTHGSVNTPYVTLNSGMVGAHTHSTWTGENGTGYPNGAGDSSSTGATNSYCRVTSTNPRGSAGQHRHTTATSNSNGHTHNTVTRAKYLAFIMKL